MTNKSDNSKNEQKPISWILMILAGAAMLFASYAKYRSLRYSYSFDTIDMLRITVGSIAIGLGCYKLIRKKFV